MQDTVQPDSTHALPEPDLAWLVELLGEGNVALASAALADLSLLLAFAD